MTEELDKFSLRGLTDNRDRYVEQSRRTTAGQRAELPPRGFVLEDAPYNATPGFLERSIQWLHSKWDNASS